VVGERSRAYCPSDGELLVSRRRTSHPSFVVIEPRLFILSYLILDRSYRRLLVRDFNQVSAVQPRPLHTYCAQHHQPFNVPLLLPVASVYLRDTNATALQLHDYIFTMPVELRKRKEAPPAPVREAKKKAPAKGKKSEEKTVVEKVQETVAETVETVKEAVSDAINGEASKPTATTSGKAKTGDTVDLTSFGGEIETHDGNKTTLAKLVEESKGGVVLFTYPKASTPGCE
jgi:hypothetical protein